MAKRRKKLKKGIGSLEEQIRLHKMKREEALKEGNAERAEYYKKEIETFENIKDKKEKQLSK